MADSRVSGLVPENEHYVSRTVVPYKSKDEKKSPESTPKVALVIEEQVVSSESKSLEYSVVFKATAIITKNGKSISYVIFERKEECSDLPDRSVRALQDCSSTQWKYRFDALTISPDGSSFAFILKREKETLHSFRFSSASKYNPYQVKQIITVYNELIVFQITTKKLFKPLDLGENEISFMCDLDKSNQIFNRFQVAETNSVNPVIIKYFSNNPKMFVIVNVVSNNPENGSISRVEITSNGLVQRNIIADGFFPKRGPDGNFIFPYIIFEYPLMKGIVFINESFYKFYSLKFKEFRHDFSGSFSLFALIPGDLGYVLKWADPRSSMKICRQLYQYEDLAEEQAPKNYYFDDDGQLVLVHEDEKNATVIKLKRVEELKFTIEYAKPIVTRLLAREIPEFSLDTCRIVTEYVRGDISGLGLFSRHKGLQHLGSCTDEVGEMMRTANPAEQEALAKYIDRGAEEALKEFSTRLAPDSEVRTFIEEEYKANRSMARTP